MSIKTKARDFWTTFQYHKKDIEKALDSNNQDEIKKWNDTIGNLCLDVAGCYCSLEKEDDFYILTFEPHRDKTSQIICVYLKKFVPSSLVDNWMIFDCIPPLCEKIFHFHFSFEEKNYTIDDLRVTFIETPKVKDSFSIVVCCEAFENMNQNEADGIAQTYCTSIFGDLINNAYVEKIICESEQREGYKYVAMRDAYDEIIEFMDIHEYRTYCDCTQIYSIYKLDENEISDEILKDRVLISTIQPLHFVNVMNHERSSLNQVNRLQGEVGYLVLSIPEFNETEAQRKRILEKELNDLLYDLGIARVCGSGIARKRIYFEVFIFDKEEFKKAIVKVVSKLNLPITYIAY